MPNILTHAYIAEQVWGRRDREIVVGSTLPDFAGMQKDFKGRKLDLRKVGGQLGIGIDFHHSTDQELGLQPEFPKISASLTAHLEQKGIERPAARLSAHFVADILLDIAIIEEVDGRSAYERLRKSVLYKHVIDDVGFDKDFTDDVKRYFGENRQYHYSNPGMLALMTQRRLQARSERAKEKGRISPTLPEEEIMKLADVIEIQNSRAIRIGRELIVNTIAALKD